MNAYQQYLKFRKQMRQSFGSETLGKWQENAIAERIKNGNLEGNPYIVRNIYVPTVRGTTEIDLIMLHEKGIFVIESKSYSGWIFGNAEQKEWTQTMQSGKKYRFYNPMRQNRAHVRALARYLNKPLDDFVSLIIFDEDCTLKAVPESTEKEVVTYKTELLKALKHLLAGRLPLYSVAEQGRIYTILSELTNKTDEEKQQHVEDIKTKCPYCGAELVLRNGKYGKFWGCSTYPNCKFTRKEDA